MEQLRRFKLAVFAVALVIGALQSGFKALFNRPPPPRPVQTQAPSVPVSNPAEDARRDPAWTIIGSWAVDSRATLDANAGLSDESTRHLKQNVLPGMSGVVVTYEHGGKSTTSSSGRPVSDGQWKAVKVEPPSITVQITRKGEAPTTTTMEVIHADSLRTTFDGVTLVLRRTTPQAERSPGYVRVKAPAPAPRTSPQGVPVMPYDPAVTTSVPGGDADSIAETNRRMEAENARVRAMNAQVDEANAGGPLHVRTSTAPPPSSDTGNRDALLRDKNLSDAQRRQLQKNADVERKNRKAMQEEPLYR